MKMAAAVSSARIIRANLSCLRLVARMAVALVADSNPVFQRFGGR